MHLLLADGADGSLPEHGHALAEATAGPARPASLRLVPGATNLIAAMVDSSARPRRTASFSLLARVSQREVTLLDGLPQSLSLEAGTPARFRFVVPAGGSAALTASLAAYAGPAPRLSLYASASESDPIEASRQGVRRGVELVHAAAGEPARLLLMRGDGSGDIACGSSGTTTDRTECTVHVVVLAAAAANITVSASSGDGVMRLPLDEPALGCGLVAAYDSLQQYGVLLNAENEFDDRLTLELHECAGKAELYADRAAPPALSSASQGEPASPAVSGEYSAVHHSAPLNTLDPIEIPAADLHGRAKVYAAGGEQRRATPWSLSLSL